MWKIFGKKHAAAPTGRREKPAVEPAPPAAPRPAQEEPSRAYAVPRPWNQQVPGQPSVREVRPAYPEAPRMSAPTQPVNEAPHVQNPPPERPVPRSAILPGCPYMPEDFLPVGYSPMQEGRMDSYAAPQPMEYPVQYGMQPPAQPAANPGYTPGVRTPPMEYLMAPPIVQQPSYPTFDDLPRERSAAPQGMQPPAAPTAPEREPEVRPAQTAMDSVLANLGIPRQVMRSIEVQKLYASLENKETIPEDEPSFAPQKTPPVYEAPRANPYEAAPAQNAPRRNQMPRAEQPAAEAPAAAEAPRRRRRANVQPTAQVPEAPVQAAPVSRDGQPHRRRRRE